MQLQRARGRVKLHKTLRILWRRGGGEGTREQISLRKELGKIVPMTRYETQFWSGWRGQQVGNAFDTHGYFATAEKSISTKLQQVEQRERLFFDAFWTAVVPRARITELWTQDARWDGDGSRISLCTAVDLKTTARQAGRWGSCDLGAQPVWLIPQKETFKCLTTEKQPAKSLFLFRNLVDKG